MQAKTREIGVAGQCVGEHNTGLSGDVEQALCASVVRQCPAVRMWAISYGD